MSSSWRVIQWSRHVRDHKENLYQVIDEHGNQMHQGRYVEKANLIAAAPDMLAELEAIEKLTTDLKILTGIRMVIAKAKGQV